MADELLQNRPDYRRLLRGGEEWVKLVTCTSYQQPSGFRLGKLLRQDEQIKLVVRLGFEPAAVPSFAEQLPCSAF
jgi:hypothetical protein